MLLDQIKEELHKLTKHKYIKLTKRGNRAIALALSLISKGKTILIPSEGGWITYKTLPKEKKLNVVEVECEDASLLLSDLKEKIKDESVAAILYQNPGGYFAPQPMKEIYTLCQSKNIIVIIDVSGGIGTEYCDGEFADIMVCSFGEWKLVEAGRGGFISCKEKALFSKITEEDFSEEETIKKIKEQLTKLPQTISTLLTKRERIVNDLSSFSIRHKYADSFVVIIVFYSEQEKEKIVEYCIKSSLSWTQCPRYIRLNKPAISIELKREK